jgi:hypothetical protein
LGLANSRCGVFKLRNPVNFSRFSGLGFAMKTCRF